MPSLSVVPKVEALTHKPVLTASIATTYAMLKALNLEPIVPGAGALLSGAYGGPTVWRKPAKVRELALSLSE
jgi:maleate isomerase